MYYCHSRGTADICCNRNGMHDKNLVSSKYTADGKIPQ